ncbi:FAT1 (YBR041W) [Zygosaccharomyces parabailii]|nr:FAT1 (YBR041W) [Zygosaccharomyces parabailii]CDH10294.1 probable Very long-chain fatty acid transport protein [Zygosaccharomyces bailii ISA1307]
MSKNAVSQLLLRALLATFRLFKALLLLLFGFLSLCFSSTIDYLDRRYRIKEDFHIIPFFLKSVFCYCIDLKSHKFQYWYHFVKQVEQNADCMAISYPRPLAKKGDFQLESYTYKETYDIVLRLSYVMYQHYGVRAGDNIAVDSTNKPLFLFLMLAAWNIGAVPAFLNYNTLGKPLVHALKISSISQVFIDPQASGPIKSSEKIIQEELPDVKLHYLNEDDLMQSLQDPQFPQFLQEEDVRSPQDLTDYRPAMYIYTSGTTGLPKSAIMSWRKAVIGCKLFARILHMGNQSIVFTAMPLFHSTATLLGVCAVWSAGGCVAISNKFSASNFWKEAYLTNATHAQYVGETCRYLLHTPVSKYEDMHSVKVAYGNGLRPDIWQKFRNRFHIEVIGEFYAATEAPLATTSYQKGEFGIGACRNYGSIVQWFLSFQQTLVRMDPEDDSVIYRNSKGFCERPAVGEPGEMLMRIFYPKRPETSFQGYVGNKKETDSKVIRDVFRKGDAWYRTGDLLRADKYGLWYFMDRMGDTFRWKSENVSTTEVEDEIMNSNQEDFDQVAVVGIKVPGYEGRAGFATIKLNNPGIPERRKIAILNEMLIHLTRELPKYAFPIFVKLVDTIEMTDTNKVPKKKFRNQVLPHGANGKDTIYWLKDYKEYKKLTSKDWAAIESQDAKL